MVKNVQGNVNAIEHSGLELSHGDITTATEWVEMKVGLGF